jgi:hypothetical protein
MVKGRNIEEIIKTDNLIVFLRKFLFLRENLYECTSLKLMNYKK